MSASIYTSKADKFREWLKKSVVEEAPPKLYACEVCGKLEADNEKWQNCENRINAHGSLLNSDGTTVAQATLSRCTFAKSEVKTS